MTLASARLRQWLRKPRVVRCRAVYGRLEALCETIADSVFDAWNRLDFGGLIKNDRLVTEHSASLSQATAYEAITGLQLRILISEALKINPAFETFIDIGSGKGKACIYAAREFDFKQIIGVEFSGPLVEIARDNARKANVPTIDFQTADATEFRLPADDTLVFLYNPFEEVVLERFLANNLDHFRSHRSVIAYENDRHRRSLRKFGFETVFRDQTLKRSLFQLPPLPPAARAISLEVIEPSDKIAR